MDPLSPMRGCGAPEGPSLRRPMDAVEIGPRTPQEDEFALLALGVPSLYQGFLDPRRLPSLSPLLDQGFWLGEASGSWTGILARFLDLCREPGCGGLVVKSPNHVFRYRALVRRFPKASFVWILRDPTKLWTSNAGMWKAMTAYYGLWETPPGTLETFLAGALDAFRGLLEELRAEGTLQRDVVLDYGDLVREPGRVLKRLVPLLGLTGDQGADWVRAAVPRVSIQGSSVHSRLPAAGPGLEALRNLQAVIRMETGVG